MSRPIIAAIRKDCQIPRVVFFQAIELGHLASVRGVVRAAYSFLAHKWRCSLRTAIRHIKRLVELGFIEKIVTRVDKKRCEVNTYRIAKKYLPSHKETTEQMLSDKSSKSLPPLEEKGKFLSLSEEIRQLKLGLKFNTPGTIWYISSQERLQELLEKLHEYQLVL